MNLTPWKLWTPDGQPAANTEDIVAVLESVLLRNPNHLGANHYYIHAVEASRTPARALPSAQRLTTLAESSGHLLHMPAHVYARTGDHAGAAAANAAGAAADRRYLVSAPPNGMYGMMYYPHNLQFLADSHMMQGRFADAKQAADRVAEHLNPHAAMMPMVESVVVTPVSVLLRFSRHADILATAGSAGGPPRSARLASLRARNRAGKNRQSRRKPPPSESCWRRRLRPFLKPRHSAEAGGRRRRARSTSRRTRSTRVSPPRARSTIGRSSSGSRRSRQPTNFRTTSPRCGSIRCASRWARRFSPQDAQPTRSVYSATISSSIRATHARCSVCRRL